MKIKALVANVGQTIIDGCGYLYVVESVYDKYVSIGNGEFIMHQDYEIIEDSKVSDIEALTTAISNFYSKYSSDEPGHDFCDRILMKSLNRLNYKYIDKVNPRHMDTFEDFSELEGDERYEYVSQENPKKVS